MKNIKENNIRKTLWHIKRHCKNIENNYENEYSKIELFHLKSSIEILNRILNTKSPIQTWTGGRVLKHVSLNSSSESTLCQIQFGKYSFQID